LIFQHFLINGSATKYTFSDIFVEISAFLLIFTAYSMQNQKSPFDISSSSPPSIMQGVRVRYDDCCRISWQVFVRKQDGGASSFMRGWVLKIYMGSFLLPHTFFPKNILEGCTSLQGGKRIEGVKNIKK
jgi:hypothetical protein